MTDQPRAAPTPPRSNASEPGTVAPNAEAATVSEGGVSEASPHAAGALFGKSGPTDLPAQFGRYRVEQLLGQGGMGTVYRAYDTQLDRHVALKVPIFGREEGELRERFLREARAAANLHHPNLCPVFDIGEQDGIIYLTMAYIDGKPLSHYLNAQRSLPAPKVVALVRKLALALQEAHDHGIIHRDLKPGNILINRKKEPVVMDFGLARRQASQDERLTQSGVIVGTPAYMPPEQINSDVALMGPGCDIYSLGTPAYMPPEQINSDVALMGPGCDIYSLGIILYEMLANRRPFEGPMGVLLAQIMMDEPPSLTRLRPNLDPALEAICFKALAKQPQDRYPSMRAFADVLDSWLGGEKRPLARSGLSVKRSDRPTQKSKATSRRSSGPNEVTIDYSPPTLETDGADLLAFLDEPPQSAAAGTAAAAPTSKRTGVWIVVVVASLFVTCVLPAGWMVLKVSELANRAFDGLGKFGERLEDQRKEQDRLRAERNQEKRQLENAARSWRPPPADAAVARLFPKNVTGYHLAESDDKANVADLDLTQPGRRALYRGNQADAADDSVEVFAYRATKLEKEALLMKAIGKVTPGLTGLSMPGLAGLPSVLGSADSNYLSYDFGSQKTGAAQYGTFVWQDGWLILAARRPRISPARS
jgi:serine/threonine protein kinase